MVTLHQTCSWGEYPAGKDDFCVACPMTLKSCMSLVAGPLCSPVHSICARFLPNALHVSIDGVKQIDLEAVPFDLWDQRVCIICNNEYGICIKCEAHGCKNYMHVTCVY